MRAITQKQIKAKKKAIVENTAINIGYAQAVFYEIPAYAMIKAIKENTEIIKPNQKDIEVENILITESIKNMNYQDFKDIQNYFF